MKKSIKYFIMFIVVLDILFLMQWASEKYYIKNKSPVRSVNNDTKTDKFMLTLDYGDIINDHNLNTVSNKLTSISNDNQNFKYIYILSTETKNINVDNLIRVIELKKIFNSEQIKCIFMFIGEFDTKKKKELSVLQGKYSVIITSASKQFIKDIYNLNNCKCGYNVLLDRNNKVRFAHPSVSFETLVNIIKQELQIKTLL